MHSVRLGSGRFGYGRGETHVWGVSAEGNVIIEGIKGQLDFWFKCLSKG